MYGSEAVRKANIMLGIFKRSCIDRSKETIIPLYKRLVTPHLEYCCQIWSPYYKKDIKLIEGVQTTIHQTSCWYAGI